MPAAPYTSMAAAARFSEIFSTCSIGQYHFANLYGFFTASWIPSNVQSCSIATPTKKGSPKRSQHYWAYKEKHFRGGKSNASTLICAADLGLGEKTALTADGDIPC